MFVIQCMGNTSLSFTDAKHGMVFIERGMQTIAH